MLDSEALSFFPDARTEALLCEVGTPPEEGEGPPDRLTGDAGAGADVAVDGASLSLERLCALSLTLSTCRCTHAITESTLSLRRRGSYPRLINIAVTATATSAAVTARAAQLRAAGDRCTSARI